MLSRVEYLCWSESEILLRTHSSIAVLSFAKDCLLFGLANRVVVPLCSGNIDTTVLGRCLERGLASDGRLIKFTVQVDNRANGVAELARLIGKLGVRLVWGHDDLPVPVVKAHTVFFSVCFLIIVLSLCDDLKVKQLKLELAFLVVCSCSQHKGHFP